MHKFPAAFILLYLWNVCHEIRSNLYCSVGMLFPALNTMYCFDLPITQVSSVLDRQALVKQYLRYRCQGESVCHKKYIKICLDTCYAATAQENGFRICQASIYFKITAIYCHVDKMNLWYLPVTTKKVRKNELL